MTPGPLARHRIRFPDAAFLESHVVPLPIQRDLDGARVRHGARALERVLG